MDQERSMSESTPLLLSPRNGYSSGNHLSRIPPITVTVDRILDLEHPITAEELEAALWPMNSVGGETDATATAYALVILLEARKRRRSPIPKTHDVYKDWDLSTKAKMQDELLERIIIQHWSSFVSEYRSPLELDAVFWTQFSYTPASCTHLRVADLMTSPTTPNELTSHPVTLMLFSHTWEHGSLTYSQNVRGILRRYDSTCTPWRVYLLELASTFIYIGLLGYYVMIPPTNFHTTALQQGFGLREYLLTFFALSLISSWNIIGPLSVILCLVNSFPNPVYPDTNGFGILLFAFLISLLQLHFLHPPTPLLLFSSDYSFPLSVFIRKGLSAVIQPIGHFFAPIFVLLTFLFSYSMADTFPPLWKGSLLSIYTGPAPMPTRTTLLFAIMILLLILGFAVMVLTVSMQFLTLSGLSSDDRWFRFSEPIGCEGQREFFKCVAFYARPYAFPAPFNLIATVLVKVPTYLLAFLKYDHSVLSTVERIIWRVTVGLFTTGLASLRWILEMCRARFTVQA